MAQRIDELHEALGVMDAARIAAMVATHPELVDQLHNGETPLTIAAMIATSDLALPPADGGDAAHRVVGVLLSAGANPELRSGAGWTPLHIAACAGNERLCRALLDAGAATDVLLGELPGSTPQSFTLFYAHREVGRMLAEHGRAPDDLRSAAALDDLDGIDRWLTPDGVLVPGGDAGMAFTAPIGAFPPRVGPITDQLTIDESLTWATRNGSMAAVRVLVARGADVNANPYRGTPLLWAAYADRADMIELLVELGADVDLRHDFGGAEHGSGATALHLAAQYGCEAAVDALLAAGADLTIRDAAFASTPAGWAQHNGLHDMAARLGAGG